MEVTCADILLPFLAEIATECWFWWTFYFKPMVSQKKEVPQNDLTNSCLLTNIWDTSQKSEVIAMLVHRVSHLKQYLMPVSSVGYNKRITKGSLKCSLTQQEN